MARYVDSEEKEIHCRECNGYLWSVSIYDEVPELIKCPFMKDPTGHCTERYPKPKEQPKEKQNARS